MKEGKISRVIVERFRKGEDILERLTELARTNRVMAGSLSGIGLVEKAAVGFFGAGREYSTISLEGPLEVVGCIGNISVKEGEPFVHAHIFLSDDKGRAFGGHLMPGCIVDVTFEATVSVYSEIDLVRALDPGTKVFLLQTQSDFLRPEDRIGFVLPLVPDSGNRDRRKCKEKFYVRPSMESEGGEFSVVEFKKR